MISVDAFKNKTVAVMGLGKSGLSAAGALEIGGAEVWAWDDVEDQRIKAETKGLNLVDLYECDWKKPVSLVLSPGIPHQFPQPHAVAKKARENGCEIICDVELLARAINESYFIGVTGTNGKSTTTALIGHILAAAGKKVEIGGNYGIPALELEPLGSDGIYVLELSSFQLERIRSVLLDISVILNISPDHLDRHGGIGGYIASKLSILDRAKSDSVAIIGMDDTHCRGAVLDLMLQTKFSSSNIVPISASNRTPSGVYIDQEYLIDDFDNQCHRLLDFSKLETLPGRHNWQNAAAAFAVARIVGVEADEILDSIRNFPGLPHRQELVRTIGQVSYINDSKATNCEATAKALSCYERIHWIAGGQLKHGSIEILKKQLGGVEHVYLIGESADKFLMEFEDTIETTHSKDLTIAIQQAHNNAQSENRSAVVLLSPACASFDQFKNFESRGESFQRAVEQLA